MAAALLAIAGSALGYGREPPTKGSVKEILALSKAAHSSVEGEIVNAKPLSGHEIVVIGANSRDATRTECAQFQLSPSQR